MTIQSTAIPVKENHEPSGDGDVKRMKRLLKNRESAQASRERKKAYVEMLEKHIHGADTSVNEFQLELSQMFREVLKTHELLLMASPNPPPSTFDVAILDSFNSQCIALLSNTLSALSDTNVAFPLTNSDILSRTMPADHLSIAGIRAPTTPALPVGCYVVLPVPDKPSPNRNQFTVAPGVSTPSAILCFAASLANPPATGHISAPTHSVICVTVPCPAAEDDVPWQGIESAPPLLRQWLDLDSVSAVARAALSWAAVERAKGDPSGPFSAVVTFPDGGPTVGDAYDGESMRGTLAAKLLPPTRGVPVSYVPRERSAWPQLAALGVPPMSAHRMIASAAALIPRNVLFATE